MAVTIALAALLGLIGGVLGQRWVGARAHRYEDELGLPARRVGWMVPVTVVACGMLGWQHAGDSPVVLLLLVVAAIAGVVLAAVDLDVHRLPDAIQLPAYPILVLGLGLAALQVGDRDAWVRALIAGAVVFTGFLVVHLVPGTGLGFGDVKLLGLIGLLCGWFGWSTVASALYGGIIIGGLVAAALVVTKRANRRTQLAYGPSLVAGAWLALVLA